MPTETKPVSFRLTLEQYAALDQEAEKRGMTIGAFARHRAIAGAGQDPPRVKRGPPRDAEEIRLVLAHLGRIGGNINQLARVANATGAVPALQVLEAMLADISAMRSLLVGALGVAGRDP